MRVLADEADAGSAFQNFVLLAAAGRDLAALDLGAAAAAAAAEGAASDDIEVQASAHVLARAAEMEVQGVHDPRLCAKLEQQGSGRQKWWRAVALEHRAALAHWAVMRKQLGDALWLDY